VPRTAAFRSLTIKAYVDRVSVTVGFELLGSQDVVNQIEGRAIVHGVRHAEFAGMVRQQARSRCPKPSEGVVAGAWLLFA
jgi:hypothetical protein